MSNDILSLQEKTIKVIIQNFSRFAYAYSTTQNDNLKRNLHFLQRAYTRTLYDGLVKTENLEGAQLDFLLNDYLKELDIASLLNHTSPEALVEKVKCIGFSVDELSCTLGYDRGISTITKVLPHIPNVSKISIPYFCTDEVLKLIALFCPKLTELDIRESPSVTNEGLLCTTSPLKVLNLLDIFGIELGVEYLLKHIPTLEQIFFAGLPQLLLDMHKSDSDNNVLLERYNLTHLDFSSQSSSMPLLMLCAELCPRVKTLQLGSIQAAELEVCCLFSQLESFTLTGKFNLNKNEPNNSLNRFLKLRGKNLKYLNAKYCSLSVSTLMQMCQHLECLFLTCPVFHKVDKRSKNVLNRLYTLHIDYFSFSEEHCTESIETLLLSSPQLENLTLNQCRLEETEFVAIISKMSFSCLLHLNLNCTDIEVDLLQQIIINCPSLRSVFLDSCENISEEEVNILKNAISISNRKIAILWNEETSHSSFSDYDLDDYDFDVFEYDYDDVVYDDYEDDDDYDDVSDY